jgi:uncharacterized protein
LHDQFFLGEAFMADRESTNRGFARMTADKQREIASKGGRAAHQKGTAHKFTSEEAREAGRKGGQRSRAGKSGSSQTESHRDEQGGGVSLEPHAAPGAQGDRNDNE